MVEPETRILENRPTNHLEHFPGLQRERRQSGQEWGQHPCKEADKPLRKAESKETFHDNLTVRVPVIVEFWPLANKATANKVDKKGLAIAPAMALFCKASYILEKAPISSACPKKRAAPRISKRELTTKARLIQYWSPRSWSAQPDEHLQDPHNRPCVSVKWRNANRDYEAWRLHQ